MKDTRRYTRLDHLCFRIDDTLRALLGNTHHTDRVYPGRECEEPQLTEAERKKVAGFMRVNHAGEICAQALYHGQGLVSRQAMLQEKLKQAAIEEGDHLLWCRKRLVELGSRTSILDPLWYAGSLAIGIAAGLLGDQWSLAFLAETETQVVHHLEGHLQELPKKDHKTARILQQMQCDEAMHRDEALRADGKELPHFIKKIMSFTARMMVKTSYWV